jgi:hypothetical protein
LIVGGSKTSCLSPDALPCHKILLPSAVYKVRNKLDHASDANRVTPKEATDISKMVIDFMNEIFH